MKKEALNEFNTHNWLLSGDIILEFTNEEEYKNV